jgi:hypothetical protein
MSYEGTNHKLCARGHYSRVDALQEMYVEEQASCPYCSEPITHEFAQDQTNGDDPEHPYTMWPDMTSWKIEAEKGETCNLGHFHATEPARYRVPDTGLWREIKR